MGYYTTNCMCVLSTLQSGHFLKEDIPYSGLFSKGIYFRIFRLAVPFKNKFHRNLYAVIKPYTI